jgi:hypothetical protein
MAHVEGAQEGLGSDGSDSVYTVRLYFAEPDELKKGGRVFDVLINGEKVLSGFDVVAAAGSPRKGVIKEFKAVNCKGALNLLFEPKSKDRGAILSGIEVVRE